MYKRQVIDRAAVNGAVRRPDAGLDGQRGLCINGGHAEEGDDPHPENRAGAAGQDGAGSAYNVAGTHLSGDSGGQRLKRTHAAVMLLAVQRQVAEHLPHSLAEAADLDKPGLDLSLIHIFRWTYAHSAHG